MLYQISFICLLSLILMTGEIGNSAGDKHSHAATPTGGHIQRDRHGKGQALSTEHIADHHTNQHSQDQANGSAKHKAKEEDHKHKHEYNHRHNQAKNEHHAEPETHRDEGGHNDHNDHHDEHKFGEGKAILAVINDGAEFELSKESIAILEIGFLKIDSLSTNSFRLAATSIVEFQNNIGVYVHKNNWFKLVAVEIIKKSGDFVDVRSLHLQKENQVVSHGVALLRVAHLEASGQGGQGHVH